MQMVVGTSGRLRCSTYHVRRQESNIVSASPPTFLSAIQLNEALSYFDPKDRVRVLRVRPHNQAEIRRTEEMTFTEFKALVLAAFEEEHLPGGDLEVVVPGINQRLVGHHDGVFWLEQVASGASLAPNPSIERTSPGKPGLASHVKR